MDSDYLIDHIASEISKCKACPLYKTRTLTVPGKGNPKSKIMIIGEAPGHNEDLKGIPFVGKSGRILDNLLISIGLDRTKIFITNMVKCRPPKNRNPNPTEISQCSSFLDSQILTINPLIIITLGVFSLKKFLPNIPIKNARGLMHQWNGYNIYPIYHPAAALYNPTLLPKMESDFENISRLINELENTNNSTQ